MELNDLKIFMTVASEKSISKAASSLGYAQSNISMRIKVLEDELQTKLLNRTAKGSELTGEGEKLLVYAKQISMIIKDIHTEFALDTTPTTLKIGASQTILASILPQALLHFKKQFPDIQFSLFSLTHDELYDLLNSHKIDIALLYKVDSSKAQVIGHITDEAVLIFPENYTADALADLPILSHTTHDCPYHKIAVQWSKKNQLSHTDILHFDTLEAIASSVTAGIGISIIPKSFAKNVHGINYITIQDIDTKVDIYIAISKNKMNKSIYTHFLSSIYSTIM